MEEHSVLFFIDSQFRVRSEIGLGLVNFSRRYTCYSAPDKGAEYCDQQMTHSFVSENV